MTNFSQAKKVLVITLLLNWLVAAAKIFIGFSSGALSVAADGFHSFFDGFSNVLGLVGLKVAERPKDHSHPYGHQKFEAMAALGIVFLVSITGYEFIKSVIERFFQPRSPEIALISFLALGGAFLVDLFVYLYESSQGRKLKSTILTADALHTKTHLITTPSVILGMIAIKMGFVIIDPLVALLVIFMLGKLAWEITRHTSAILCDGAFIDEKKIEKISAATQGVISSHQIRTRGDVHHVFLDMHITLDPKLSLESAHNISHRLKEKIMKEIPEIKDVIIHLEPKS